MANRRNNQFFYTSHNKPTLIDCSFKVDNTTGVGVSSLNTGGRVSSVFMKAGTPSGGNPMVAASTGLIQVILQDNYYTYLGFDVAIQAALTGSNITSGMTIGAVYQITTLGASTAAQWITSGVPSYITPAVGVSYVAKATTIAGGGTVQALHAGGSQIDHIEQVGNAGVMNSNGAQITGAGTGMTINLACYAAGVLTDPAQGTIIDLQFYLNDSQSGI